MKLLCVLLLTFSLSTKLLAMPSQVILIRHAEKPDSGNGLSKKGFQRAAGLVPFFTVMPLNPAFRQPMAIFAQSPSTNHQSTRPVQTVSPLANALGIELIALYTQSHYADMVKEIKTNPAYDNQTVMICWSHQFLGDIAKAFGVSPAPTYPSGIFDRLWVIDFSDSTVASFQDLPQQLLCGDSAS